MNKYKNIREFPCWVADCNRCGRECRGHNFKTNCTNYIKTKDTFMLAELALAHPQSLHDALSSLPFDTNLDFYLS